MPSKFVDGKLTRTTFSKMLRLTNYGKVYVNGSVLTIDTLDGLYYHKFKNQQELHDRLHENDYVKWDGVNVYITKHLWNTKLNVELKRHAIGTYYYHEDDHVLLKDNGYLILGDRVGSKTNRIIRCVNYPTWDLIDVIMQGSHWKCMVNVCSMVRLEVLEKWGRIDITYHTENGTGWWDVEFEVIG